MPLIDDLKFHPSEEELRRRKFLGLAGGGALAAIGLGAVISTVKYLEPNVLFEESTRFAIGRPEDLPVGTLVVIEKHNVFVLRTAAGILAMSAVCTHLGCTTRFDKAEGRIFCPCHGSAFDAADGRVVEGPAPRPLVRLQVALDRGQLYVDTAVEVSNQEVLRV